MVSADKRVGRLAAIAVAAGLAALVSVPADAGDPAPLKVGAVTRHADGFVGRHVVLRGYLLARKPGYILFSDEARGRISRYDLPVTGADIEQMAPMKRYVIEGEFLDHGLAASNGSPYHLELSAPPREASR